VGAEASTEWQFGRASPSVCYTIQLPHRDRATLFPHIVHCFRAATIFTGSHAVRPAGASSGNIARSLPDRRDVGRTWHDGWPLHLGKPRFRPDIACRTPGGVARPYRPLFCFRAKRQIIECIDAVQLAAPMCPLLSRKNSARSFARHRSALRRTPGRAKWWRPRRASRIRGLRYPAPHPVPGFRFVTIRPTVPAAGVAGGGAASDRSTSLDRRWSLVSPCCYRQAASFAGFSQQKRAAQAAHFQVQITTSEGVVFGVLAGPPGGGLLGRLNFQWFAGGFRCCPLELQWRPTCPTFPAGEPVAGKRSQPSEEHLDYIRDSNGDNAGVWQTDTRIDRGVGPVRRPETG
jgi:hypothetical protein